MALPIGYVRLDYITCSQSQYIKTDVVAPNGFRIVADIIVAESLPFAMQYALAGSEIGNSPWKCNWIRIALSGGVIWQLGVYGTINSTKFLDYGGRYIVDASTVKGDSYIKTDDSVDVTSSDNRDRSEYELYLCANNKAGTAGDLWIGSFGICSVYVDNILVKKYIPCKNPDGIVGMYDEIDGEFHSSDGNEDFIAGPEIDPDILPMRVKVGGHWKPVELGYVKVNGIWKQVKNMVIS